MKTRLFIVLLASCLVLCACPHKIEPEDPPVIVDPDDPGGQEEPTDPTDPPDPPEPEGPKSEKCDLTVLRFFPSANPSIGQTIEVPARAIRGMWFLFVTLPETADLTAMVPAFEVSKKAKVTVDGTELTNGKTPVDLSAPAFWTVVAEDGEHSKNYLVIPRKGDSGIDQAIYNFMGSYNLPGVSIALSNNDHIVYSAGYGLAEVNATEPVFCTENHLFRLASVSKTLTAICILRLCFDGLLHLEDKIFAPGGCLADVCPGHSAAADEIRILDLLTHRSGWNNYAIGTDPIFTTSSNFYGKSVKQRLAFLLANYPPSRTPGTYDSYFNMGFSILGLVIEQVSGLSYEDYLRETVSCAGAFDVWVSRTARNKKRPNECVFYSQDTGYPYDNNTEIAAACGGVTASAPDLARILCAIDYNTSCPDILPEELLDKMYTNYTSSGKGGYGLGWWIGHNAYPDWAAFHTGTLSGTATLWVRGNNGVNGVILCNSRSGLDSFDGAMYDALDKAMKRVKDNY